jgi:hypothetical protein
MNQNTAEDLVTYPDYCDWAEKYDAVTIVLIDPDMEKIITVRIKGKVRCKFPSGRITNEDANPEAAAIRIVKEITGLTIDPTYIERIVRQVGKLDIFAALADSRKIEVRHDVVVSMHTPREIEQVEMPRLQKIIFIDTFRKLGIPL